LQGARWYVGDGTSIDFWKDPWVPNMGPLVHWTNVVITDPGIKVSDFIKRDERDWETSQLEEMLSPVAVEAIRRTTLPMFPTADIFMWKSNLGGQYTVKSGYNLIHQRLLQKDSGSTSAPPQIVNPTFWSRFWQLKLQPKIRIFIWKGCHGALALGHNLQRRVPSINSTCPMCGDTLETWDHLMWLCPFAARVWFALELGIVRDKLPYQGVREWLQADPTQCPQGSDPAHTLVTKCIIMWGIWMERNAVVFRGAAPSDESVMRSIFQACNENFLAFMNVTGNSRPPGARPDLITPLGPGARAPFWTIITDGAVNKSTESVFGAAILLDDNGQVYAASVHTAYGQDPLLAEGLACRAGLLLATSSPEEPRVLFTDSLALHNLLTASSSVSLPLFGILEDIRHLLHLKPGLTVTHAERRYVRLAHTLCKRAASLNVSGTWTRPLIYPELSEPEC
jgi:hypothetical protein